MITLISEQNLKPQSGHPNSALKVFVIETPHSKTSKTHFGSMEKSTLIN